MLYLIKSAAIKKDNTFEFILKIGYAKDVDKRFHQYIHYNPTCILLAQREGSEDDEKIFHEYFKAYKYPKLREWFYYNQKIVDEFSTLDLSNLDKGFKYQIKLRELRGKIKTCLPEDIKNLAVKFSFPMGELEDLYLIKFYHIHKLWERNVDLKLFKCNDKTPEQCNFLRKYYSFGSSKERLRFLCDYSKTNDESQVLCLLPNDDKVKGHFQKLGPPRCYAFSYQMSRLEEEYQKQLNNQRVPVDNFENLMSSSFKEGKRYTNVAIKNTLQGIYDRVGLKRVAKASDLEEWFVIKKCLIPENKKRLNGLEIIKKRE